MRKILLPLVALLAGSQLTPTAAALAQASAAQAAGKTRPSPLAPSEIVAAAPKSDWTAIPASDLLVMDLTSDAKGKPRRVVIQLLPPPFSQGWIGNIRTLAAAHWWDGLSINRVQDNYVVQWGDANGEDKAKAKALPTGLVTVPESEYRTKVSWPGKGNQELNVCMGQGLECPEYITVRYLLPFKEPYAEAAYFAAGWPLAFSNELPAQTAPAQKKGRKNTIIPLDSFTWPVHCYGMVGVGRDLSPNTGSGAELYVVIGHAPRHLDRNIALVGRVIEGIEHLSSLPRGTGGLGFYETAEERTGIQSIRLGTEVPGLPAYEYLSTESPSFAKYADARANRRDAFFIRPAGGADICNIPVPVRRSTSSR
jgi:peptidylprolyl isomerase